MIAYRSLLFVPGDSQRKQTKALTSGADALILDLEDSVAPDAKDAARARVAEFLSESSPNARLVRVNALETGLTAADVAATLPHSPQGYVLPKCEGPDDIAALSAMIGKDMPILAIATETVRAVRQLMRLDWTQTGLGGITWGGEDLAADLGAMRNRVKGGQYLSPFLLSRDLALFAAKEAQVSAVDAVFPNFQDTIGLKAEAEEAFELGFDGKMAIHPAQIPTINAAFTPSSAQVAHSKAVVSAMDDSAVAQLNGVMLDLPHLKQAKRILRLAEFSTDSLT